MSRRTAFALLAALLAALIAAGLAACGGKSIVPQTSASYSVPHTVDDLVASSTFLVSGRIVDEPAVVQIANLAVEPGEQPAVSAFAWDVSHVVVSKVLRARPGGGDLPLLGVPIPVAVAIVNPLSGRGAVHVEANIGDDFPKAGDALGRRTGDTGVFLLGPRRSLDGRTVTGYEVVAFRSNRLDPASDRALGAAGPLGRSPFRLADLLAAAAAIGPVP